MKKLVCIFLSVSLLLNLMLFATFINRDETPETGTSNLELRTVYPYLSPRVFLEEPNDVLVNFVSLRTKLREYQATVPVDFGIYFEYLPSGVSIGVNDQERFVLASLLKVPLVMGIYKQYERGELTKDEILTIKEENLDPFFGTLWKKGAGTQLTVDELVKLTLIYSDNTAQRVLFSNSADATLEDVFDSLDIPKELDNQQPVVNAKNYSSILRSLYLSSYLSEDNSNEIMDILTQSQFNDKLVAGVPADIKVAHKIGVHQGGESGKSTYTDCGIVYVPKRPYILCMMIKANEPEAQHHMKEVSRYVYEYVSQANGISKP